MANNVFISFRYSDGIGYKERLSKVFDASTDIINCSEDIDRSMMSDATIKNYLYGKLSRSSITIILLTPHAITHKKNYYNEIDDWIYDEIRYSLEDREYNRSNGLIAVYTKEAKELLTSYDVSTGAMNIKPVYNLFRKNMMNVKSQFKKNPNFGIYDANYDSYCSLISYEEFINNPNKYIEIGEEKRNNIYKYNIYKRM